MGRNLYQVFDTLGDDAVFSSDVMVKAKLLHGLLLDNPKMLNRTQQTLLTALLSPANLSRLNNESECEYWYLVIRAWGLFKPRIHKAFGEYVERRAKQVRRIAA